MNEGMATHTRCVAHLGRHERAAVVDLVHQVVLLHRRVQRAGGGNRGRVVDHCESGKQTGEIRIKMKKTQNTT